MIEDKLTHIERLHLEALNQAVQSHALHRPSDELILATAKRFLSWITPLAEES